VGRRLRTPQERFPGRLAVALLAVACLLFVGMSIVLGSRLSFFNDDWYFLLQRPGWSADALFAPNNGHLSVLDVVLYNNLTAVFGLDQQWPFRLVLGLTMASLGVVVYLWVVDRAGPLLALAGATLVLFLGAAWEDLLFFASISLIGALAAGLGGLYALRGATRRGDVVACVLLTCSVGLSNLGLTFAVAAAIALAIDRRPRALWTVVVPLTVFAVWWAAYGHDTPSHVTLASLEHLPRYILDAASIGLATVTGLNRGGSDVVLARGRVLLLVAGLLIAAWMVRGGRAPLRVLVPLTALVGFWVLAGAGQQEVRGPTASRYQLINAVLIILIAAELFRPVRLNAIALTATGVVWLGSLASNIDLLHHGYSFMHEQADYARVDLGALELARDHVDPAFRLTAAVARNDFLFRVSAGPWFRETGRHGTPAVASVDDLLHAPPAQRQAADSVLAGAEALKLRPAAAPKPAGVCVREGGSLGGSGAKEVIVRREAILTNPGDSALILTVRRFAEPTSAIPFAFLAPRVTMSLAVPADKAPGHPWRIAVRGPGIASVCTR
jgi:hypothetical protein